VTRKFFPSDEQWNADRRKGKPHVKIHHSIKNHPKTLDVWADPERRGMLTEIWRLGSERGAAHTDNWLSLTQYDCCFIAGRKQYPSAEKVVRLLAASLDYATRDRQDCFDIHLRNFAKKQSLTPHDRRNDARTPDASPLPSPHTTHHTTQSAESGEQQEPKNGNGNGKVVEFRNRLTREEARDIWNEVVRDIEGPASERVYSSNPSRLGRKEGVRLDLMLREYSADQFRKAARAILTDEWWAKRQVGFLTLAGAGNMERMLAKGGTAAEAAAGPYIPFGRG
jgi:hypothetical protein